MKLTKAQREYLESMLKEPLAVMDICSGGAQQCVSRMRRMGLVEYVNPTSDWRDGAYLITEAGTSALLADDAKWAAVSTAILLAK